MTASFIVEAGEDEIRRERAKARALRATRWWKQKLAQGACHYCGRRFPPEQLTMDHIVPIIRGGKTNKNNVATVCKECNNNKKYLLPMEWDEYMKRFSRGDETT
jgi:5-methylcytosine-specific restriction endonuclease McrA